ncbi:MAG: hypothetical protein RL346_2069 [Verrucomicrobiota bacterium]
MLKIVASRTKSGMFLSACLAVISSGIAAEKPNVLLICVDDLKPLLGCYGNKVIKTPNIDSLAARSVIFENAYCNQAVCAPSRNALMTGLRPDTIGIYDLETNFREAVPNAVTIPQAFMKAGYKTSALGKIMHVGHGNKEDAASWSTPHWSPKAPPYALAANIKIHRQLKGTERGPATESADVPDDFYGDGKTTLETIKRLREYGKFPNQPFFLAFGLTRPHLPFVAPKRYWDLYKRADINLAEFRKAPENAPPFAGQEGGELRRYHHMPAKGALPDDLQRELIHGYYAATSYADSQIGLVLKALDDLDLTKHTIIILWGDHGWHLGDHGFWCKHTNFEQATHIPFLIALPGNRTGEGKRTRAFVETVDLYPTLCELAEIPAPPELDGQSLANILRNPELSNKTHAFHVYPRSTKLGRAIRTSGYRFVEWKVPGAPRESAVLELYDMKNDPLETRNIAANDLATIKVMQEILAHYPEAKPQVKVNHRKVKSAR